MNSFRVGPPLPVPLDQVRSKSVHFVGHRPAYFFDERCESVLAAAVLLAALDRLSRRTLDAALAAALEVCFFGAPVCDRALPAAVFEPLPVDALLSVCDAFEAAFEPVTLLLAIISPPVPVRVLWRALRAVAFT